MVNSMRLKYEAHQKHDRHNRKDISSEILVFTGDAALIFNVMKRLYPYPFCKSNES
jgi:hypothetical protein